MGSKFAKKYKGYRSVCMIDTDEKRRKDLELFDLSDVWGVGRQTLAKLNYYGIHTPLQFADKSESWVRSHFTLPGLQTWKELNGVPCIDTSEIAQKQSICTSRSFGEMINLLKDEDVGYGDDFDFEKFKMINIIVSNHMQDLNLDMNPIQYKNFDYDKAKEDFYAINARYFRAIYFCMAPLLCVPMYQQIRPQEDIYGRNMQADSSFWEHEALANFWGENYFKHPSTLPIAS